MPFTSNVIATFSDGGSSSSPSTKNLTVNGTFLQNDIAIVCTMPNIGSSYMSQIPEIPGFTRVFNPSNPGDGKHSIVMYYKVLTSAASSVTTGNFQNTYASTLSIVRGYYVQEAAMQQTLPVNRNLLANDVILLPTSSSLGSGFTWWNYTLPSTSGVAYQELSSAQTVSIPNVNQYNTDNGYKTFLVLRAGVLNETPSVTSQTPRNYDAIGSVAVPSTFSWTYSDSESNTQYKYEISYRQAGTTGTYTTVTSANGVTTTSHTFAANTFTDGVEYEWRLRLDDNQGGGWSSYSTAYFTAGTSKWVYGPPVTSASTSNVATTKQFLNHTFETTTEGWQNNSFFGTYTDCTFTNSVTRPKTGTRSLEITWPTNGVSGQSRCITPEIFGFEIGKRYRIYCDIYVPTGSPNVRVDPFLQNNGVGGLITDKDTWVATTVEFEAANASIFFGVVVEQQTTNTQKCFVDNFRVESLPLTQSGAYQVQVRTSDATKGFGAWSTSATMTVNTLPIPIDVNLNPQRVGGNINVTWDYNDVDSQAQTKYKIRYKKKA